MLMIRPLSILKLQDSQGSDLDLNYTLPDALSSDLSVIIHRVNLTRASSIPPQSSLRPREHYVEGTECTDCRELRLDKYPSRAQSRQRESFNDCNWADTANLKTQLAIEETEQAERSEQHSRQSQNLKDKCSEHPKGITITSRKRQTTASPESEEPSCQKKQKVENNPILQVGLGLRYRKPQASDNSRESSTQVSTPTQTIDKNEETVADSSSSLESNGSSDSEESGGEDGNEDDKEDEDYATKDGSEDGNEDEKEDDDDATKDDSEEDNVDSEDSKATPTTFAEESSPRMKPNPFSPSQWPSLKRMTAYKRPLPNLAQTMKQSPNLQGTGTRSGLDDIFADPKGPTLPSSDSESESNSDSSASPVPGKTARRLRGMLSALAKLK
jgi:hypothetical protein